MLGWRSGSSRRAILLGALLSLTIEVVQTGIPGRDPSLSDLAFNTAGAAVGVAISSAFRVWLDRPTRVSKVFGLGSLISAGVVMLATALLLQPIGSATLGRDGDDIVVRSATRATAVGLDQPEYWLRAALPNERQLPPRELLVHPDGAHWQVTIPDQPPATVGPTLGQGWAVLAYPDAIGRRWGAVINGLWILALCVPIGLFARGKVLLGATVLLAITLALLPRATGLVDTTRLEWLGAAIGILLGFALDLLMARFRRDEQGISQWVRRQERTLSQRA